MIKLYIILSIISLHSCKINVQEEYIQETPCIIETKTAYIGNGFGLTRDCEVIYYSDGSRRIKLK